MFGGFTPRSGVEGLVLFAAGLAALVSIGHYTRKGVSTVLRFFRRMDRALDNVERQLYPNGGHSLRDGQDRLEQATKELKADVATQNAAIATIASDVSSGFRKKSDRMLLIENRIAQLETRDEANARTEIIIDAVNDAANDAA